MLLKGIGLSSQWVNSKPIKYDQLIGKIVLVDFWTYSCVNCVRTVPHMNKIYDKYSKKGLMVIGIHTPEFDFEKEEANVKNFIKENKMKYPVLMDNDYSIWNFFSNSYWPRQYLFDANGDVFYDHIGEGSYEEIEENICQLLGIKYEGKNNTIEEKDQTPEIYFGSLKHTGFGNSQVCRPGSCITYIDNKDHIQDKPYLNGQWVQNPDSIKPMSEGYISLNYRADSVNIVASGKAKCIVTLNGNPLTKENAGEDVKIAKGVSFVEIDSPRMYNIIKTKNIQMNEIKIIPDNKSFEIFTFTFG